MTPAKQKIRCLIVDDEPLALNVMQTHLGKVSEVEIFATCSQALEAFDIIQRTPIDLIFLDIQMPELTGIGLVKALENPPKVIFTTAYREYALEGFELDVVDYLLKPISLPRLLRALDKYRRLVQVADSKASHSDTSPRYLSVHANRQRMNIKLEDILYIESMSDYVKIHLQERVIVSKQRISHLQEKLNNEGFLRIHRSYLVSIAKISTFTNDHIFIGSHALPVGRTYKQAISSLGSQSGIGPEKIQ